ncbi:MAG: type IX secretion system membrane protein PorP/SprF [Bacteroidales bacterium]|nr:type IX secretion system membrane protein PorP/SprF [Bacteroidales bacterium]MDY0141862.1 type IX secretion system membrane protein PorP/SprF [Bacteroidales bacterium]
MKSLLVYLIISLFAVNIFAQQVPLYSQYLENNYIINPGVAGSEKMYSPLLLSVHKQWIGIQETPSTQYVSLHHRLANDIMGIGGLIFHDSFGPVRMIGIQSTYAYHLKVGKKLRVSFGLNAIFMQYILQLSQDDFYGYEPILTRERTSVTVPDASFGVYAYSENYWGGISISHVLQSKMKISGTWIDDSNKMVRHYFAMGGYKFSFPGQYHLEIEPSVLFKFTETTPLQTDFNMKIYINKRFYTGLSVRSGDSFVAMFGFTFDDYFFGLAYDFTFSDLSSHTIGSQELVFGWNLGINSSQGRSFY